MSLMRIALWGPLLIAALLAGAYVYMHDPFARDGTELLQVPLSEEDPSLDRVGDLKYLGGLDIPKGRLNVGGLSALLWNQGVMLSLTDDGRRVRFSPQERDDRLIGFEDLMVGPMHDMEGVVLSGKALSDAESLTRSNLGGLLIGFERDHRIWYYPPIEFAAEPTAFDPVELLGSLEDNNGVEALAGDESNLVLCAEQAATPERPNCVRMVEGKEPLTFGVLPPDEIADRGAVPTDTDVASDGTLFVLFRSYSPAEGNTAAIVAYAPDGTRREIATFLPPLTLDNFEGLAVREEEGRTFLYIVSDDNFSGSQRTLLMKFEIMASVPNL